MDDHILADMGITRNDIVDASRLPVDVNASLELEKTARANKTYRKLLLRYYPETEVGTSCY
ncbi:MAG: hypothetical protein GY761_21145 [Hyphomicrobiales bacterium]|nr:hypothetical protein [Hyphomicrobiales bacterium]